MPRGGGRREKQKAIKPIELSVVVTLIENIYNINCQCKDDSKSETEREMRVEKRRDEA